MAPLFGKLKSAAFGDKIISRLLIAYRQLNSLVDPSIISPNLDNEVNTTIGSNYDESLEKQEQVSSKGFQMNKGQQEQQQSLNQNVSQYMKNRNVKYTYPQNKYKFNK